MSELVKIMSRSTLLILKELGFQERSQCEWNEQPKAQWRENIGGEVVFLLLGPSQTLF